MDCLDRFSSRRQLIDFRHVEVAILSHGERPWYRCRCHDESVRREFRLLPETSTLRHTKTMLFVNDAKPEVLKLDSIFYQSMRTYYYMYIAVFKCRQDILSLLLLGGAGQQCHRHFHITEHFFNRFVMLRRKYFRRSHQSSLITIVEG